MLKKFSVRNYKNFRNEIEIDFQDTAGYQFSADCISDGFISKMIIYGRNATGKTNLGRAIGDIEKVLFDDRRASDSAFLNADSKEEYAEFSYTFQFGDKEIIYRYKKLSDQKLSGEEFILNGERIFQFVYSDNIRYIGNLEYIEAETIIVERFLQMNEEDNGGFSFLRWIINNAALKRNSLLILMSNYVRGMVMLRVGSDTEKGFWPSAVTNMFFESLEDKGELNKFEEFLNFMGIECKLYLQRLPDGQRELYFSHDQLVPFYENASSGTLALMNLYRRFIRKIPYASFMYLDEFDAFYHYEMAENLVEFLKEKYPNCQIIMTTHNTNLMTNRLMRPDCLFILSREGRLTPLCRATRRELREGHNLEKMYISGEFEKYE